MQTNDTDYETIRAAVAGKHGRWKKCLCATRTKSTGRQL